MLTDINELVRQGRFEAIFKALEKHPLYTEDERFEPSLYQMWASFSGIQSDEIDGTPTAEHLEREKAVLRKGITLFTRRFGITQVDAPPAPAKTPITAPQVPTEKPVILFLASDPRGMGELKLNDEFVKIRTHLDDKIDNFKLELKFEQRPDTLTKTILDERPTYVHFAGHGVGASDEFNPAGIVLEDRERNPKVVPSVALANMFRLLKKRFEIKAVVLNACDSTEQAKAISTNGIYAIGMADEIPDPAAIAFAGGFYLGLAEAPDDITFAYEMALNSLLVEGTGQAELPKLFLNGEEVVLG